MGVTDLVFDVRLHLPLVGRVSLAHVDCQKIGMVLVVVEDLDDVADLATERRSGKTPEDQDQWLAGGAFAKVEGVGAV